jgi:leader peptidase (prepilin peptidase)/N-methyltransferase
LIARRQTHSDIVSGIVTTSSPLVVALSGLGGAVLGNFLSACIRDLPQQRRIAWPVTAASRWLIVELATAVLCAAAVWWYGATPLLVSRITLGCALIVLFAIDLEHRLLLNAITLPGIAIGFLFSFVCDPGWRSSLIGIAIGGGLPYAVAEIYFRVRKREGVGMGDVKMLAMIGAFLGWPGALLTLMFASMAGSAVGLAIVVFRRGTLQYALPFGTFLAAGAVLFEVTVRILIGR